MRAWLKKLMANVLLVVVLAGAAPSFATAQGADDVSALNERFVELSNEGKYVEAASIAEQALTLAEKVLGNEHPDTLTALNNMAFRYQFQGRYADAEPLPPSAQWL